MGLLDKVEGTKEDKPKPKAVAKAKPVAKAVPKAKAKAVAKASPKKAVAKKAAQRKLKSRNPDLGRSILIKYDLQVYQKVLN